MIWLDRIITPKHEKPILLYVIDLNGETGCQVGYYDFDDKEYFIAREDLDHCIDYAVLYWCELPDAPQITDN